jgi:RHS repeat-associated protein
VTNKTGAGAVIDSFTYTLDLAGHRTRDVEVLGGNTRTATYTYDNLYRLTQEQITDTVNGNRTLSYTYDLAGNRVTSNDSGAPSNQQPLTYTYNDNDELTGVVGPPPNSGNPVQYTQTISYDANGNELVVTGHGGATSDSNTWDLQGRLVHDDHTNGSTLVVTHVDYGYDDAGNRVSQLVNGAPTTYLNDPHQAYDQVLEEYAANGVLAATYVRGLDLLFQDRSGVRSYYAKDGLGSTRALTSAAGAVTDTYTYNAYGNLIGSTGTTTNEFLFAGYQSDAATGLDYLRARYYDAAAGRFTARDSYDGQTSNPLSLNHYAYASADPANRIDPSGHEDSVEVLVSMGIGATLSGLDAAIAGKSPREIVASAVLGGIIGAFGPALGSIKYLRAVAGGTSVAFGIIGAYEAYLDGKFSLAAFRGVTSFASLALMVTSAVQSGALRPLLPAGRVQVGRLAANLQIRATQQGFRDPGNITIYKAAMLDDRFDFSSLEGRIGGFRTLDGTYYVGEGHHRMEAALEILAESGDDRAVRSLLTNGVWTEVSSPPSGSTLWSTLAESLLPDPSILFLTWGSIEDIFS